MIYLRELSEQDITFINKSRNNRNLVSLLGSPFRFVSQETDEKWFNNYLSNRSNNIRCVICSQDNDFVIGVVYLLNIDWISRQCEFGIFISSEEYQGKGIGTLATKMILEHGFFDLNLNRIYLTVLESNKRAIGLYSKIGFKQEGTMKEAIYKDGVYQNLILMSILRKDFLCSNE